MKNGGVIEVYGSYKVAMDEMAQWLSREYVEYKKRNGVNLDPKSIRFHSRHLTLWKKDGRKKRGPNIDKDTFEGQSNQTEIMRKGGNRSPYQLGFVKDESLKSCECGIWDVIGPASIERHEKAFNPVSSAGATRTSKKRAASSLFKGMAHDTVNAAHALRSKLKMDPKLALMAAHTNVE